MKYLKTFLFLAIIGVGGYKAYEQYEITQAVNAEIESQIIATLDTVKNEQIVTNVEVEGIIAFRETVSVYSENNAKLASFTPKVADTISKGSTIATYDTSSLDTLDRQIEEAQLSLKSAELALEALNVPTSSSQIKQLESQVTTTEKNITDLNNNLELLNTNLAIAQRDFESAEALYTQGAMALVEYTGYETKLDDLNNQIAGINTSLLANQQSLEANKIALEEAINKADDPSIKLQIESQKVAIEQAELKISNYKKDIADFEHSTISPITGTVISTHVNAGESVSEGRLMVEIGDPNDIIIEAYVPEEDMLFIVEGQEVLIENEHTKEEYYSTVTRVYPIAEKITTGTTQENSVKIEVALPKDANITTGFSVDLTITTKINDDALVVPIMAYMTESDGSAYVYVVDEENILEKRVVEVLEFQGAYASVTGLELDEVIVTDPSERMSDGVLIIPFDVANVKEKEENLESEEDLNSEEDLDSEENSDDENTSDNSDDLDNKENIDSEEDTSNN